MAFGHPLGQMVAFAGILFQWTSSSKFPNVRIGFMEAGVSWLQTCLERFDRGWETHIQYDPRKEYIQLNRSKSLAPISADTSKRDGSSLAAREPRRRCII